ncbi:MAG: sigma-70 family RNA polymerase sigma factor [Pseudomonadota bacterium]
MADGSKSASDVADLLRRIAARDRPAFDALYQATAPHLYAIALRILKSSVDAEEAVQETYLKIWTKGHLFEEQGVSANAWLTSIARNTAIDKARRRSRTERHGELKDDLLVDDAPDPEALAARSSEAAAVRACLEELPADRRTLLRRAFFEGLSYPEIAERTETALSTVKSRIRRSLKVLGRCLDGAPPEKTAPNDAAPDGSIPEDDEGGAS